MSLTVGRLAKRHGLSRSTLLYYDAIGLLRPSGRSQGDYRLYDAADEARLAAVCRYRRAGLSLAAIAAILDGPSDRRPTVLESRLDTLEAEIATLVEQRRLVLRLLGRSEELAAAPMDRARWVALLRKSGFSEEDMSAWHAAFELDDPEGHQAFLEFLRIPEHQIAAIRARAREASPASPAENPRPASPDTAT